MIIEAMSIKKQTPKGWHVRVYSAIRAGRMWGVLGIGELTILGHKIPKGCRS
jgi:hypothetical protein